jgi:hypothetical protein
MNTREIASAVNKDDRTVARWIMKASDKMSQVKDKVSEAKRTQKPADYNLEETCFIIEQGLGKNASNLFRSSAIKESKVLQINKRIESVESMFDTNSRLDRIEAMLELIIKKSELKEPEKQLTFNEIPEKTKRAELREIINKYTAYRGCNHIEVWSQLYQQIYYRMNINVKLCADNRGMDKLDYIEKEGLMDEVVLLASKLFEVK